MWLHIMGNDKFVGGLQRMFEAALPGEHVYGVRLGPSGELPAGCVPVSNKESFLRLLSSRADWRGVVFNPLYAIYWDWLPDIPEDLRVVWYTWGGEAFNSWPLLTRNLYQPKTKEWVYKHTSVRTKIKENMPYLPRRLYYKARYLRRVDVFVSQLREEYDLFRKVHLLPHQVEYHFGSVGTLSSFAETPACEIDLGKDILLGNSATPTNNHMEAIDRLAQLDLSGRKVIVPLSYDTPAYPDYREMVLEYGHRRLGVYFEPLLGFLPLAEYQSLLNRCGYVVMNHHRQSALGNIVMMIMKGAKVLLNDTSVYREYISWGLHLCSISTMGCSNSMFTPLNSSQIEENRAILYAKIGEENVVSKLKELLRD